MRKQDNKIVFYLLSILESIEMIEVYMEGVSKDKLWKM